MERSTRDLNPRTAALLITQNSLQFTQSAEAHFASVRDDFDGACQARGEAQIAPVNAHHIAFERC